MAGKDLQCWTRYANDGHKYITCKEKEIKKKLKREDFEAKLLLAKFNTPVGAEQPSSFLSFPDDVLNTIKEYSKPLPLGKRRQKVSKWKKADYDEFFDYLTDDGRYIDGLDEDFSDSGFVFNTQGQYDRAFNKWAKQTQKNVIEDMKNQKTKLDGKTNDELMKYVLNEFMGYKL